MSGRVSVQGADLPGLRAMIERFQAANRAVYVGVPVGAGNAHEIAVDGSEQESKVLLAVVAAANEFGTDRIPERSFLRAGLREGEPKFQRLCRINLMLVARGEQTIPIALEQLGSMAAGEVQRKITRGPFVPNAPATLVRKYPKTHPLENTGHLKQVITYVVGEDQPVTGGAS